ncbi:MAG: alpha/beta fold hydrolase [Actinobacteria bacterium]|nr:alpha/beta fold hydrolase [Actinomycetota bacterium]
MKVLLLHAWPLDESMWTPQAAGLQEAGYEVQTPRLYGRGASIDGWAAQILRDFDGPLVAVGASMGGYCALALARRAPERMLGLLLAGSRAGAESFEGRKAREERISELRVRASEPLIYGEVPPDELATAQEAMRDRLDLTGMVASFGGPLLVCIGDEDEIVSVDEAQALAEGALQGSLEVFPGAGHIISIDQPERFNAVLLEFLSQWA